MYVLAQLEGRKPEMGAVRVRRSFPMCAVLSVVGGSGSFGLQLENEQKWLIYGPATRTHEGGGRTNRTNNKYITHRSHRTRARTYLLTTEVAG